MSKEQKGRLLIVDDTPSNLHLLMNILSKQGYVVYPATEGELALKFVQATPPDLILLDIFMPGMDGYQVCQRLKADENTRDIPVIFISSADQVLDKVKAFAIGGVDYIVKPFQTEEVLARIETHLALRNLQKHLEERVEERTAKLSQANARLTEEIAERKRTEAVLRESQQLVQAIIDNSTAVIYVKDLQGRFLLINRQFEELFHITRERADGKTDHDIFSKEQADAFRSVDQKVLEAGIALESEELVTQDDGLHTYISIKCPLTDATGNLYALCGISTDITERKKAEALRSGQSRILEMIATSSPLADTLESLTSLIESQSEGMLCSVLLLDDTGQHLRHGAAPSLPESYTKAIDGVSIGPQAGSCGTAAFRGQPVFVTDIEHDPLWQNYKDLAAQYGLRACWSSPIISHEGMVLGTFAMYYREPRSPNLLEIQLIDIALHIAGIAIERLYAEQELRNSEARYRTLVEHAPEALVVLDMDTGLFVDANERAFQLFGYSKESLFKVGPIDLSPPRQPDGRSSEQAILENLQRVWNGEAPAFEWTHRDATGKDIPCEIRLVLLPSMGRRLVRGSIIDITERIKVSKALRASEKRFDTAFQASPIPLSISSMDDMRMVAVNEHFLALTGYTREEVIGRTALELNLWSDYQDREKAIQLIKEQGNVSNLEGDFLTKNGELLTMIFSMELIEIEGRECLLVAANDISERKRAEQELQKSAHEISVLYNHAPCGYHALDMDGTFLRINDTELNWLGYSRDELIGKINISQLIPSDYIEEFQINFSRLKQQGSLHNLEFEMLRKNGSTLPVLLNSTVIKDDEGNFQMVNSTLFDITDRKRLEAQFRHSQKMEAVGRLAGGIAHDFNNLLTAILGYSQLALLHLDPQDHLHNQIQEILKAAERAALLTSQLLAFSRRQILQPQVLDLNLVIDEMDNMLRRLIGEDIELLIRLAPSLAHVKADPGQIAQVIMNLAINARDAMPLGGQLIIETANVEFDQHYAHSHLSVVEGAYVMLAVSDTGEGIAEEHQSYIFEPFFTTKEKGKGTGLGLSTIYGIIEQSGGSIEVASELGKGASFKIFLPRVKEALAVRQARIFTLDGERGKETILLVEDEEIVRKLASHILEASGYTVLEASDGGEALRQAEQYRGVIHLLVTDVVMPRMNGRELSEHLLPIRPEMKVLYMSGYTDDEILHRGILESSTAFMQKPFTPDQFLEKIRDVLEAEKLPLPLKPTS